MEADTHRARLIDDIIKDTVDGKIKWMCESDVCSNS